MHHIKRPTRFRVFLIALSLLYAPLGESCFAAELQAGLARIDITPTEPVMLAGYASRKELSRQVHDPLFARVLAFDQDHQRLVLVAVDNWWFYYSTDDTLMKVVL